MAKPVTEMKQSGIEVQGEGKPVTEMKRRERPPRKTRRQSASLMREPSVGVMLRNRGARLYITERADNLFVLPFGSKLQPALL